MECALCQCAFIKFVSWWITGHWVHTHTHTWQAWQHQTPLAVTLVAARHSDKRRWLLLWHFHLDTVLCRIMCMYSTRVITFMHACVCMCVSFHVKIELRVRFLSNTVYRQSHTFCSTWHQCHIHFHFAVAFSNHICIFFLLNSDHRHTIWTKVCGHP